MAGPVPARLAVFRFSDAEETMGRETVYVPHDCGIVLGSALYRPWIAQDAMARADRGQPVFREASHAMAWLRRWLEQNPDDGLVVAVVDVTTRRSRGRRIQVEVDRKQLLEPYRQLVLGAEHSPYPRALHMCYSAAARDAVARVRERFGMGWRRSTRPVEAAGRLAFAHGYRAAYSNAGRMVAALVADSLHATCSQLTGYQLSVQPRRRPWLEAAPVPASGHRYEPSSAALGELGIPRIIPGEWVHGVALGGAHGALEAAAEFRAAVHLSLGRRFGTVREPVDAILHQALRSVVPVWADQQLAEQATRPTRRERALHAADQYQRDTLEYATGDDLMVNGVAYDSTVWEHDGEGGVRRRQVAPDEQRSAAGAEPDTPVRSRSDDAPHAPPWASSTAHPLPASGRAAPTADELDRPPTSRPPGPPPGRTR
jgi:hypothetical protein